MSTIQKLTDTIDEIPNIREMVITTRDGRILHQKGDQCKALGNYIAYAALTSEQIKPYLGFSGPYHLIMEQTSKDKILIMLNENIIVGLDLNSQSSPAPILDKLNPLVAQITF